MCQMAGILVQLGCPQDGMDEMTMLSKPHGTKDDLMRGMGSILGSVIYCWDFLWFFGECFNSKLRDFFINIQHHGANDFPGSEALQPF